MINLKVIKSCLIFFLCILISSCNYNNRKKKILGRWEVEYELFEGQYLPSDELRLYSFCDDGNCYYSRENDTSKVYKYLVKNSNNVLLLTYEYKNGKIIETLVFDDIEFAKNKLILKGQRNLLLQGYGKSKGDFELGLIKVQ